MFFDPKASPIVKRSDQPGQDASSNSPANEQRSATTSLPNPRPIGRLVWLLGALNFLFIFNRNLNQSLAMCPVPSASRSALRDPNRVFNDPYELPVQAADDPLWVQDSLKFDYLLLSMQWPVTYFRKEQDRLRREQELHPDEQFEPLDSDPLQRYVEANGYRFTVHGLWAGIQGEPQMGTTRLG